MHIAKLPVGRSLKAERNVLQPELMMGLAILPIADWRSRFVHPWLSIVDQSRRSKSISRCSLLSHWDLKRKTIFDFFTRGIDNVRKKPKLSQKVNRFVD